MPKEKILIVDSDTMRRNSFLKLLNKEGYEATTIEEPDKIALSKTEFKRFDLILLGSKELEAEIQNQERVLSLICKIGREISSTLKLDEVLQSIVDKVSLVFGSEICAILLLDEETDELYIRSARGLDEKDVRGTQLKIGERISGWVLKQNKSTLIEDINKDPRFKNRDQERYYNNSLISVPLVAKDKLLGVINVNNKKTGEAFNNEELKLLEEVGVEAAIAIDNARIYESLQRVYMHTIKALISAIDARDHYTRSHSEHVTKISVIIAEEMGLSDQEIEVIKNACQLHDLGKIGIHDYILTKPGRLTEEEWEEIKLHSLKGAEILEPLGFLNGVIDLVRQHHERFDGKGYPYGYKEEAIMLGARIMSVADSYDAMISERPYRKRPLSKKEAIEEIKKNSGTQFDPKIVEAFLRVVDRL